AHPFEGPPLEVPVKYNRQRKILSQLCHIIQKTDTLSAGNGAIPKCAGLCPVCRTEGVSKASTLPVSQCLIGAVLVRIAAQKQVKKEFVISFTPFTYRSPGTERHRTCCGSRSTKTLITIKAPRRCAGLRGFGLEAERATTRRAQPQCASTASSNSATILVILIIGFTAGPAVSL